MYFIKERIGKMLDYLKEQIYPEKMIVESFRIFQGMESDRENPTAEDTSLWKEFHRGEVWGGSRSYYWFEMHIIIPEAFADKCVALEVRTGAEGGWDATNPQFSVFVDGRRVQGLDVNHREIILSEAAESGRQYRILLSAYTGDADFSLEMKAELKILDRKTEKYYYDLKVPYDTACLLSEDEDAYIIIIRAINSSLNLLDMRKEGSDTYYHSLEEAQRYITEEFYDRYCGKGDRPVVFCVGHTHIDCAWLWTLKVTEDKAVRSFSTVLELMKRYPEYKFMSSQPQLYEYVKKNAPQVYEEIRLRVAEGRWEPEGGMWVEADCNLASGEALVRQFMYGKRFFRREFGKDNEILWLPDVFGYSAALPQIMRLCGIRYFMTTKISWNETNKMPYDTFLWEGLDGSRTLTHFIPTRDYQAPVTEGGIETAHYTTYNGYLNPSQVKGGWARYQQKELNREVLCSYGYGDGGGGPTADQLENQRRMQRGIPGLPETRCCTALEFFKRLEERVMASEDLPVWSGELYLEYHRGTYTTMARNKKYNRQAEFACQNSESFAIMDHLLNGTPYPKLELEKAWIILLRNQFHDILPGSSIQEVYEDSRREYEALFAETLRLQDVSLGNLAERIGAQAGAIVVFNPNSGLGAGLVEFAAPAEITDPAVYDADVLLPIQKTRNGYIFAAAGIPSKGYKTYTLRNEKAQAESALFASDTCLENKWFRIELNDKGQFRQIYEKSSGRGIMKEGKAGNVLVSYEDRPHNFDAWDINHYYREKSWEIDQISSIEVTECGPVRATVRVERKYLDSVIVQHICIYQDIPRIDICNEIDWKQHLLMLKAHFPLDVHAHEATFDIQFGNVKRSTTDNTSWDWSKFEVCHHKWLDVAEDDFGVSFLNDCKYGVSVRGTDVGITLLKSPLYPNPEADKERHEFVYSLYPHTGGWREAGTVAAAYGLNNPLRAIVKQNQGGELPAEFSFFSVDVPNVRIETVKKTEAGDEMIVRLFECFNRRSEAVLRSGCRILEAELCDLMEEHGQKVKFSDYEVDLTIYPYEIKTVKLRLARDYNEKRE